VGRKKGFKEDVSQGDGPIRVTGRDERDYGKGFKNETGKKGAKTK